MIFFFLIESSIRAWAGFSKKNSPTNSLFVAKEQSNGRRRKKHTTLLAREREREIERERERERD